MPVCSINPNANEEKGFLAQIERIVPWLSLIQPCCCKGERGNKSYPLETILQLCLLQNLYGLSDEATVAKAIDSRAFSNFCGIDSDNRVPDGDIPGLFLNKEMIVDSTIISAPPSTKSKEKNLNARSHLYEQKREGTPIFFAKVAAVSKR